MMGSEKSRSSASTPPREDSPLLGNDPPLSSRSKTFANVLIAVIGAGVLGLPYTFMRTGWVTSLITIFAVAGLTYHCMMLLVHTRRKLESPLSYSKIDSFGDLGFVVCGPVGRFSVDVMIVLSQAGFCIGYLIFIGNTMANIFTSGSTLTLVSSSPLALNKYMAPKVWGISAKSLYIWACFPFQLGLNAISSLTLLAPLSIFADIVDIGAMGVVMVEDTRIVMKQAPVVEAFGTLSTFFYGLGVAMYSFEGIGMALPLESEMKEKSKFGKILAFTMIFVVIMYGTFGVMGYFAFGENTKDIITANMGKGMLSTFVQLGLCINLFFTFPLMMHPVYEVFERRFCDGSYSLWIRWMLVLVVSLVALFVPNFADFLSLVGSSTCCALGFVLPSLFHYQVFKGEMSRTSAFSDIAIIVLGVFLGLIGTWLSVAEIFSA